MESILTSTKKLLGIPEEYEHFDKDLIMHINSVFLVLNQLGVGPSEGFYIEDDSTEWTDYIGESTQLQAVKSYMYLKVKLLFDPPLSSTVINSNNALISEYEWRLRLSAENASE